MSFGTLSKFYKNLALRLQEPVHLSFGLERYQNGENGSAIRRAPLGSRANDLRPQDAIRAGVRVSGLFAARAARS